MRECEGVCADCGAAIAKGGSDKRRWGLLLYELKPTSRGKQDISSLVPVRESMGLHWRN